MQAVLDITKTIKEQKSVKHRRNEDKTCILYNMIVLIKKLRIYLSDYIRHRFGNWACISDTELYSVIKDYSIVVEEELEADEIKVNEPCPGSN